MEEVLKDIIGLYVLEVIIRPSSTILSFSEQEKNSSNIKLYTNCDITPVNDISDISGIPDFSRVVDKRLIALSKRNAGEYLFNFEGYEIAFINNEGWDNAFSIRVDGGRLEGDYFFA